jgi:ribonucleotide reductase beta subunit family protein with ferritin-like domain
MDKTLDIGEELLTETDNRFVLFPIKYKTIWDMYKKAEAAFWTAEEIDLSKDWSDWEKLSENERHFIKHVLAFFAGSDGIVNENLSARFMYEVKPQEAKSFYGFQIAMENIHCVSGETLVYTRTGYFPIEKLAGQKTDVWNGEQFSETTPYKTSINAPVYRVLLDNGMHLDCTSNHKWITDIDEIIFTQDLKPGQALSVASYPDFHTMKDPSIFSNPYMHGYLAFDVSKEYVPTMFDCRDRYEVPINYSIGTKTRWLCGALKHFVFNESIDTFEVYSGNQNLLKDVQLMLSTLAIQSKVTRDRLQINKHNMGKLLQHPNIESKFTVESSIATVTQLKVVSVTENGTCDTYCFDEPEKHRGIFNGILTGQSETYSILIDTYIKDHHEKYRLLNAINTIPCIGKKANWAIKWIEDKESPFAMRLVAFACVEGIFFSGAFCAIFWLKERGVMPGLCLSNEFISRDEALHTEFAVLLYSMLKNKLPESVIHEMVADAVAIEDEFINESIPCKLLGMNSELMSQYIKFVADRLLLQLGYAKLYNVTNPFHFMDRINLEHKANFFEDRNSQYSIANIGQDHSKNKFEFSTEADF